MYVHKKEMYVHKKEMYIHDSKCVFIKIMYLLPESR